jgi:NADH-quinone oxidoreductase subunit D
MQTQAPAAEKDIFVPAFERCGAAGLRIALETDGGKIVSAKSESGFCHRGIEKLFERRSWRQGALLAERIAPYSAAHHALAYALALEQIAGFETSKRARTLRVAACELERLHSHTAFLGRLALATGYENLLAVSRRDCELACEMFDCLCGSRAAFGFVRPFEDGPDPDDETLNRASEYADYIDARLPEYHALAAGNPSLRAATSGSGELDLQTAIKFSLSGPNIRASASGADLRKSAPYCGYEEYEFRVPVMEGGSVPDRISVRLEEMAQSCSILRACLEKLYFPQKYGLEKTGRKPVKIPSGEAFAQVESPRGRLGCYVKSDGGERPQRVKFAPPSLFAVGALAPLLKGAASVFDAALITASLDISAPETDR